MAAGLRGLDHKEPIECGFSLCIAARWAIFHVCSLKQQGGSIRPRGLAGQVSLKQNCATKSVRIHESTPIQHLWSASRSGSQGGTQSGAPQGRSSHRDQSDGHQSKRRKECGRQFQIAIAPDPGTGLRRRGHCRGRGEGNGGVGQWLRVWRGSRRRPCRIRSRACGLAFAKTATAIHGTSRNHWSSLSRRVVGASCWPGKFRPGKRCCIVGVSGAVGHAATQIAHWKKARVIGAATSSGNPSRR